jgi:hypothetical protein
MKGKRKKYVIVLFTVKHGIVYQMCTRTFQDTLRYALKHLFKGHCYFFWIREPKKKI